MSATARHPRPAGPGQHVWLPVAIAALAMVATLPGRTHGLGLVTEPLLADLALDRVTFAEINLWATLLGALFCLPCGALLDRLGARALLVVVTLGLGAAVLGVARLGPGPRLVPALFALLLLTRGLGQSALSVVSLALLGRAAGARPGPRVGVYSFLVAMGFMVAFGVVKHALEGRGLGWRPLWSGIGLAVALAGLLGFVLLRGRAAAQRVAAADLGASGLSLGQALRTASFWVFAVASSLYGLIAAGLSLFNQSILAERGFDRRVFLTLTVLSPVIGLLANLLTGWLAGRVAQGRLLGVAMGVLMMALLCFPLVRTLPQVYLYAVALGVAGGMVTVVFFAVWSQVFGTAHLGQIQGAAQMMTVVASALGPLLLAAGQRLHGSYVPTFRGAALAAGLLGVLAWLVPTPRALLEARS